MLTIHDNPIVTCIIERNIEKLILRWWFQPLWKILVSWVIIPNTSTVLKSHQAGKVTSSPWHGGDTERVMDRPLVLREPKRSPPWQFRTFWCSLGFGPFGCAAFLFPRKRERDFFAMLNMLNGVLILSVSYWELVHFGDVVGGTSGRLCAVSIRWNGLCMTLDLWCFSCLAPCSGYPIAHDVGR